ncbi:MAG: nuclear transport factor 2 family protein [Clostridiales bacterium]|nr:nuclear transport factor 2 family protein [Clostridiales bacterium]
MTREEQTALLKQYMESWVRQDKAQFLSTLHPDLYLVECYGASYRGLAEAERWFDAWNREGRVVSWTLQDTWYDPKRDTLFGTWEFQAEHAREPEPCFDGITALQCRDGKIARLFEYERKHDKFRPYAE